MSQQRARRRGAHQLLHLPPPRVRLLAWYRYSWGVAANLGAVPPAPHLQPFCKKRGGHPCHAVPPVLYLFEQLLPQLCPVVRRVRQPIDFAIVVFIRGPRPQIGGGACCYFGRGA